MALPVTFPERAPSASSLEERADSAAPRHCTARTQRHPRSGPLTKSRSLCYVLGAQRDCSARVKGHPRAASSATGRSTHLGGRAPLPGERGEEAVEHRWRRPRAVWQVNKVPSPELARFSDEQAARVTQGTARRADIRSSDRRRLGRQAEARDPTSGQHLRQGASADWAGRPSAVHAPSTRAS
jgi:hypothetical protein